MLMISQWFWYRLGYANDSVRLITSQTSQEECSRIADSFQDRMDDKGKNYLYPDSPSWIISMPRLMGIALTLTRASHALLLEPDWQLSNEEQQRG